MSVSATLILNAKRASVSSGLSDSLAFFAPTFEKVEQLAIACNSSGRIIQVNPVFQEFFPAHDIRTMDVYVQDLPSRANNDRLGVELAQAVKEAAAGKASAIGYEVEDKTSSVNFVGWSAAPVHGLQGDVEWILIQAIDYAQWLEKRSELAETNVILENEVQNLKRRSTDLEWSVETLAEQGHELVEIADEGELVRLELAAEIEERKRLEAELVRISITDPLTGAFNRRRWMEVGSEELARMQNGYKPFSIISFDIDHFKKVNDTWSHQAGDDVLISFTTVCKTVLGEGAERFFRIGGEEFVCLLQASDLDTSAALAEDLRQAIEEMEVQTCGETLQVTASLGVTRCELGESLSNVLSRADKALYQAKDGGRNRVIKI